MDQSPPPIQILEPGQVPDPTLALPPRQPQPWDTVAYIADPDRFCRQNFHRHGPVFRTSVFGGTTVFVGSAIANQMVFNGDLKYTEIALPTTTMTMFGEHSLFQRPDLHGSRKTALRPGFTGANLDHYIPRLDTLIGQGLGTWQPGDRVPLFPAVADLCFDALVPLLLGIDLNDSQGDPWAGLSLSAKPQLCSLYQTFFDGFYGLVPWNVPWTSYGRGLQARSQLLEFMAGIVARRRQETQTTQSLDPRNDFLAMMLAQQQADPQGVFSDALIQNQCLLQLWASHYEISGLVSSWMEQMGRHPAIVERLLAEQAQVWGSAPDGDPALSPSALKQLPILESTLKETLRVTPPSSTATRRLTRDVVVGGLLFKQGWGLVAEPRIAHIMAEHFQDPDRFDPDRFLGDRNEGKPYTFIPFGGGVHACLGAQMALVVAKVFAIHLLRQFTWAGVEPPRYVQFPLKHLKADYCIQLRSRSR
ncbi:cytochrome P450 [Prochlorothrix hollandica]|uniref:Cytochrome P450 n=1 Tax=Prochlorothrix hollandica PCC 9006 = CALU 1027 TaxID=317619 RepID=A0A0M2Q1H3_PROHO|nr:cytochrome P450 [Prochlorothrix hollandica]KKJ01153.1 cytochrome P450 [Prochlorothrix hollandica PCC 9006 = CALU 1027]